MFSAYQAVHFFENIRQHPKQFETVFIVNPSHTGMGNAIAIDDNDSWRSPLGETAIDKDFVEEMNLPVSESEQKREHSGEVMLPMLQHFLDYDFKILPITITHQTFENASQVALEIFEANKKLNKNIVIIASSDFSHFVHPETGKKLDQLVIDKILTWETQEVENIIQANRISVCGYGPIMALMEYSKLKSDAANIDILKKGSSGDVIPSNEVVDYVSMIFYTT
jgi:AmmeMemoRadiSam system protein B